jgi:Mn-dependent DtxR family transcriptional regulator
MFNTKDSDTIYKATINTKFIKARPIPFTMRPKVERELEKLERDGIISKIGFSYCTSTEEGRFRKNLW